MRIIYEGPDKAIGGIPHAINFYKEYGDGKWKSPATCGLIVLEIAGEEYKFYPYMVKVGLKIRVYA